MTPERFIQDIAVHAGHIVGKKYGKVGVKYTKDTPVDVVTEADLLANNLIVNAIKKHYPKHGIISEEIPGEASDAEYVWIIDPVDGTRNFVTHIPFFCVMVGLMHRGVMELAAIYDPIHDELFYAKKGKGAFLNGKRIRPSAITTWQDSYGTDSIRIEGKYGRVTRALMKQCDKESFWVSAFGSAGLTGAYVACGRRDWCFSFNPLIWDWAPAALVLQESGCTVTDPAGKPWKPGAFGIVAANKRFHPKLIKLVRGALLRRS